MGEITVLIADAQLLVADALSAALGAYENIRVLKEHPTSGEAVVDMVELFQPDVVLLDYWMDGIQAPGVIQAIKQSGNASKVVVLSWLHGSQEIENVFFAGAVGFLPKSVTVDQVAVAVQRAREGESPVYGDELERMIQAIRERDEKAALVWQRMSGLSRRELKVLMLLSLGRSARQISSELSLSERTVTNYIHDMLTKTAARSQNELLSMARMSGLIAG